MDKSVSPVKESIAVRGMPEGSKAKLLELAKASGRTFEAEARHAIKTTRFSTRRATKISTRR